jgi:hypothetical protein
VNPERRRIVILVGCIVGVLGGLTIMMAALAGVV